MTEKRCPAAWEPPLHIHIERTTLMMILIAGPYRSGTNDDPALIAANVRAMTEMALTW